MLFLSNAEDPEDVNRIAEYGRRKKLADKINDWLDTYYYPLQVHIGSDGDPFASHIYRYFMEHTPKRDNIKYSILTNGLMFESFHPQVPHIIENLQELGVSIDGASKETYEKLRLGGNWEKINRNLQCISELKQKHDFRFILHFVVQKENYHEMEKIIDLGEQYGADRVWLNKIEDWGVMKNFDEQNIFTTTHPDNIDYNLYLNQVIQRIWKRNDRFIECPTLISEEVRYRNKN
jgi:MoaA/NifB/PqqE/SkfB family radical SAM enzyme